MMCLWENGRPGKEEDNGDSPFCSPERQLTMDERLERIEAMITGMDTKFGSGSNGSLPWSKLIIIALVTIIFGGAALTATVDSYFEGKTVPNAKRIEALETENDTQDYSIIALQIGMARIETKLDNVIEALRAKE